MRMGQKKVPFWIGRFLDIDLGVLYDVNFAITHADDDKQSRIEVGE